MAWLIPVFTPGLQLTMREVLHDALWAHWSERVWKFFVGDGAFLSWYVNFEAPYVRRRDGIDVNDLQLDIVAPAGQPWRWKDVQDLAPSLVSGRITRDELLAVRTAATDVAAMLDADDRWWAPWDEWTPADGTIGT